MKEYLCIFVFFFCICLPDQYCEQIRNDVSGEHRDSHPWTNIRGTLNPLVSSLQAPQSTCRQTLPPTKGVVTPLF